MLRVSSSGPSIAPLVIRIRRRGRAFLLESSPSQCRRAAWGAHAPMILGSYSQAIRNRPCSKGGKLDLQNPQHDDRQKRGERTLYAILQPEPSPCIPLLALPIMREEVDGTSRKHIPSYPGGKSQSPTIKPIQWRKKASARASRAFPAGSDVSDATGRSTDTGITRGGLLRILESTGCAETGWNAYATLLDTIPKDYDASGEPFIPLAHLHRLCRVLASNRPKTHMQFLRILSVLNLIRSNGGCIHVHEWNVLIDHAARGWRKTRPEDLETALSFYSDMVNGRSPGSTLEGKIQPSEYDKSHVTLPDIYTYNSLINAAVNSRRSHAVRRVVNLMDVSGISPNRITFLTLLKYYSTSRQMSAVRSTLLEMSERRFELGLDGINACIWAYGQNERLDVVMKIYHLLPYNMLWEQATGVEGGMLALRQQLAEEEYIHIPVNVRPNQVTFATVIQVMAYHGDLSATLSVFTDMLKSESAANAHLTTLMSTVFRAIFLGFSRNGLPPLQDGNLGPSHSRLSNSRIHWTLQNLRVIFDTFLNTPGDIKASRSTVHWIMYAFDLTSGQNEDVLREVWAKLEARFGVGFEAHWVAPTNRLAAWRERLFPDKPDGCASMVDDFDDR